jgi:hypothetical protein
MANNHSYDISVILFQENELWIAHCLEFDIVSQGNSIESAKDAFKRIFLCQVRIDLSNHRHPFIGWDKAPKEVWDKFSEMKETATWSREPIYIPDTLISATINEYATAAA